MNLHISDKARLTEFFKENFMLTTHELVSILGVSPATVRKWKRECGIELDPADIPKDWKWKKSKKKVKQVPREIWNTREWFLEHYIKRGLGAYTIAKMINRSMVLVIYKLHKFKIPIRSHAEAVSSKNKYCSKEWLEENFVRKGIGRETLAKMAGVSEYTILYWLAKFKIPIRDRYEASVARYDRPKDTIPGSVSVSTPAGQVN